MTSLPFAESKGSLCRFNGYFTTENDVFRHEHNSMFEYYYCDNTALKTIIRSNPGLLLLNGATVEMMWHYNDFPSFDEVKTNYLDKK
jgi:hypothetical protein